MILVDVEAAMKKSPQLAGVDKVIRRHSRSCKATLHSSQLVQGNLYTSLDIEG